MSLHAIRPEIYSKVRYIQLQFCARFWKHKTDIESDITEQIWILT